MPVVKVFISSMMKGMEACREAAEHAVEGMSMAALRFEVFPAQPATAAQASLDEVRNADIFIQLVGEDISDIVEAEYEAALVDLPDRILIFVKDCDLSVQARKHFDRLKKNHTYKKFRTPEDLKREIPYAVNSLLATLLHSKVRHRGGGFEEVLVKGEAALEHTESAVWHFDLKRGDVVKGMIQGTDTFHVYFLDEEGYADYLNDRDSLEPDAEEVRAYALNEDIRQGGVYYVVVYCCAWLGTKITVFLRRFRGPPQ